MTGFSAAVSNLIKKAHDVKDKSLVELPPDIRELTGYQPHLFQAEVEPMDRRFNMKVFHRRFGKTVMQVNKLIERAVHCPYDLGRYAYLAPTYSQAEDIAWLYLDEYTKNIPGRVPEVSKLAIHLPTYRGGWSRIRLYGTDSPKQRLRGLYLDGVVFDEFPWMPMSVWTDQVRPMLSDIQRSGNDALGRRNQWADFIFTPWGRNHAYRMFKQAAAWQRGESVMVKGEDGGEVAVLQDDWTAVLRSINDTRLIPDQELLAIKATSGRSKYAREYLCDFDAEVEGTIYGREMAWLKRKQRMKTYPVVPGTPVSTAWDLGWDDATAIVFFQVLNPENIRIVDYYENSFASLSHYADIMADKGYMYGYNLFPHDVEVTELGSGKTRRSQLQNLGIRVSTVPNTAKADQRTALQALLPYCRFNTPVVETLVDNLSLYRRKFNEQLQTYGQEPVHDNTSHGVDAMMQLAIGLRASGADLADAKNFHNHGRAER